MDVYFWSARLKPGRFSNLELEPSSYPIVQNKRQEFAGNDSVSATASDVAEPSFNVLYAVTLPVGTAIKPHFPEVKLVEIVEVDVLESGGSGPPAEISAQHRNRIAADYGVHYLIEVAFAETGVLAGVGYQAASDTAVFSVRIIHGFQQ